MGSKNKKHRKGESGESKGSGGVAAADEQMIQDPRFSSAHTDPRFRRIPRRESKVTIDSRFQQVFTDKRFTTGSAPVDKRGKRRREGSGKDSMREYYRDEQEENAKPKKGKEDCEEESGDASESEKEMMNLKSKSKRRKPEKSSDTESEEDESKSEKNFASLDKESEEEDDEEQSEDKEEEEEEEEEVDTDDDDEAMYEDDGPEIPEENIPTIPEETHRLAIVNMDWRHVSAKDLYVVLNSFVPKDGRILSVAVYPTEFGLQRMKEEEIHGPVIDGDKKNEGHDDEEEDDEKEEDEDVINQKLRAYETSRLKYYFAVAECDSSATAYYLYKSCDGIEFERSSNKLDLRFIPDSMEFQHPPRDIATEAPAVYEGLDFQTRALQMSKVNLSWDEDEPHRIKTLNQKFKPEQLADLEMKEFLASDESESDDDDTEGLNQSKEEKRKDKYRALIESGDVDSDKDVEEDNDQDMEVTFNTGLEDLSKEILKKKHKKSESVWESYLRQKREKKRARKNKQKDDSSDDDDDDDYNVDRKSVNHDGDDDFFMEEPALKKKKEGKMKKKKGLEEEIAAEERSRAELELLLADDNEGAANGLKGYNIKRKGKKGKTDVSEEKIPAADLDDPRFSTLLSCPSFALDPTDPQFKRSATYARQLAAKQKEEPRSHEDVIEMAPKEKEELISDGNLGSKKEKHALTSTVKSLKMKMLNKDSEKQKAGNALSSPTLAQRIKKKAKDLSKK